MLELPATKRRALPHARARAPPDPASVADKSGGIFRIAYTHGTDVVTSHTGEPVLAHQLFNVTEVPSLVLYAPGPKRLERGLSIHAQMLMGVYEQGQRALHSMLRGFVPTLVDSVRGTDLRGWLGGGDNSALDSLPRVLLLSSKQERSLQYRALSSAFASRAVFGQGLASDKGLASTFGVTAPPALFISPPFAAADAGAAPAAGEPLLPAAATAAWRRYPGNLSSATYSDLRHWLLEALPVRGPAPVVLRGPDDFARHCGAARGVTLCFIAVLPREELPRPVPRRFPDAYELASVAEGGGVDGSNTGGDTPRQAFERVAARAWFRPDWDKLSAGARGDLTGDRLPIAFMAVDADAQSGFAGSLHAGEAPALVALNPRRRVFAPFRGDTFSASELVSFVQAVVDRALGVPAPEAAAAARMAASEKEAGIELDVLPGPVPTLVQQPPEATATPKRRQAKGSGSGKKGGAKVKSSKSPPQAGSAAQGQAGESAADLDAEL